MASNPYKEGVDLILRQQEDFEKLTNEKMEGFASIIVGLQAAASQQLEEQNDTTASDLANEVTTNALEDDDFREDGRQDIIGEGGAASYSIRYRNDGATGEHRLEWIAKATALDPDTGLAWPDDDWNEVLGGEAETFGTSPG